MISVQQYRNYPNCWTEVEVGKQRRRDQERGESCWTPESPVGPEGGKSVRRTLKWPNDSRVGLMNDIETTIIGRGREKTGDAGKNWGTGQPLQKSTPGKRKKRFAGSALQSQSLKSQHGAVARDPLVVGEREMVLGFYKQKLQLLLQTGFHKRNF